MLTSRIEHAKLNSGLLTLKYQYRAGKVRGIELSVRSDDIHICWNFAVHSSCLTMAVFTTPFCCRIRARSGRARVPTCIRASASHTSTNKAPLAMYVAKS